MALTLKDRVLESSTSTGTGSFTLTGAQTGYQSFSAIGNGNTTYYTIQGKNPDGTLTGEWEVGVGTWSTGNTLSRDTVLSNSLGTTAKIAFSAGAKDVFCDYPASKSVNQNADNKVLIPYTPGVTNVGSLNVGDATGHSDSGVIAAFTASEPLYLYTSLQNTSSANTSYASYAVNDGGHTSYGELGINNSNYSYSAAGYPNNTFSAPLATFVESYGGPLAIGTWDSQKISFIVNGSVNTADAMTIDASGVVSTTKDITIRNAKFGRGAGTGTNNTAIGQSTLTSLTNGTDNVALGDNALSALQAGNYNTAIGKSALSTAIGLAGQGQALNNTALGFAAASNLTTGNDNIAIGYASANVLDSGNGNIMIGSLTGDQVYTGSNNIYIGKNTPVSGDDWTNEIVIGANALSYGSNTVSIGNSFTVNTYLNGGVNGNFIGTAQFTTLTATDNLQLTGSATANQNIATNQTSGNLTIGGASATGSTTLNGNVKLATKSSLPTASAGLVEYDGLAFYNSIAASTRGVMPSEQYVILDTPYTLISQTAAQKLFNASTNGAVTLPIGTYQFECLFSLTSLSITSSSFGFALVTGTAVIGSQGWVSLAGKPLNFATPAQSATYNTSANTSLTVAGVGANGYAFIRGTIKITTAGTIIPSVSLGIASAAVVGANSYFKISPISKTNNANITVGNWS